MHLPFWNQDFNGNYKWKAKEFLIDMLVWGSHFDRVFRCDVHEQVDKVNEVILNGDEVCLILEERFRNVWGDTAVSQIHRQITDNDMMVTNDTKLDTTHTELFVILTASLAFKSLKCLWMRLTLLTHWQDPLRWRSYRGGKWIRHLCHVMSMTHLKKIQVVSHWMLPCSFSVFGYIRWRWQTGWEAQNTSCFERSQLSFYESQSGFLTRSAGLSLVSHLHNAPHVAPPFIFLFFLLSCLIDTEWLRIRLPFHE